MDISFHSAPGVTVGSVEGTGNVFLAANNLTTGSNSLSTVFSGVIQDGGAGGSLTKIGTGTFTLAGANTYTDGTVVNDGILAAAYVGNDGKSAVGSSNLMINNGATVRVDTTNALGFFGNAPPITINAGGLLTASSGVTQHLNSLTLSGGTLASAAPIGLAAFFGTYNLDNNVTAGGSTTTSVISALDFALTTPGGTTFTVSPGAANGIDLDVTGTIGAPVGVTNTALIKAGAGVMRMSNANTYTGPTTVVSGTLQVANDGTTTFGTLGTGPTTTKGAGASGLDYGTLQFTGIASAGNGTLTNNGAAAGGGIGGLTMFMGSSTAGHATIHNLATAFNASGGGATVFNDDSTAGFATITSDGAFQYKSGFTGFANRATLGNAVITNTGCSAPFLPPAEVLFQDDSTAGNGTINNGASTSANGTGGLAYFSGSAFAGTAAITNRGGMFAGNTSGTTQFFGASSADHSVIHNQSAQATVATGGGTLFYDSSTAGSATVFNQGGSNISGFDHGFTEFHGNFASAGSASFFNQASSDASASGGRTLFYDHTVAGTAHFDNAGPAVPSGNSGLVIFNNDSSADHATIVNHGKTLDAAMRGGVADFFDSAKAGNAAITNEGSAFTNPDLRAGGRAEFSSNSRADHATIVNQASLAAGGDSGITFFEAGSPTADHADITNSGGIISGGNGGYLQFFGSSTADHSVIHNEGATVNGASSGSTYFYGSSSAGSATLYADGGIGNGGAIIFLASSDGGTARVIIGGNGLDSGGLDSSLLANSGMNLGSLEGGGITSLGSKNLSVGGNNLSATYSGIIRDGGYSGASGGSLTKVGTGTFTLEGANTYTGDTTVSAGTLKFNLTAGVATIASGVTATVAVGATLELAGSVSALGTTGGNRVHVVNDSTAAGVVVSGTNQVVGGIDGSGVTQVNAGSDLTADHIVQGALAIGGAAGNPALVTIAASDADGNPLDAARGGPFGLTSTQSNGRLAADLIGSNHPFPVGIDPVNIHDDIVSSEIGPMAPALVNSISAGTAAGVPEPSSLILLVAAVASVSLGCRFRRKPPIIKATSETRCGDPSRRSPRRRSL